jgi:hypothetical protein
MHSVKVVLVLHVQYKTPNLASSGDTKYRTSLSLSSEIPSENLADTGYLAGIPCQINKFCQKSVAAEFFISMKLGITICWYDIM